MTKRNFDERTVQRRLLHTSHPVICDLKTSSDFQLLPRPSSYGLKQHLLCTHLLRLSGCLAYLGVAPQGDRTGRLFCCLFADEQSATAPTTEAVDFRKIRFADDVDFLSTFSIHCPRRIYEALGIPLSAALRIPSRSVGAGRRKIRLTRAVIASRSFSLVVSTSRIGPRWRGFARSLRATSSGR